MLVLCRGQIRSLLSTRMIQFNFDNFNFYTNGFVIVNDVDFCWELIEHFTDTAIVLKFREPSSYTDPTQFQYNNNSNR